MSVGGANFRPTRAEVDLGAVRDNVRVLGGFLAPGVERLAVVKANAYGHGDVEVSRACLEAGVTRLGVALVEEGVRLRQAGIDAPVLVLVEPPPSAAGAVVDAGLDASVGSLEGAQVLAQAAAARGRRLRVHACVDTGMHREGASPEEALELVRGIASLPALELEGLWSHLAVAEEPDHPFTRRQIERFTALCERVARAKIEVPVRHLASSAAIVLYPESHFDLVRMGIMVYGLYPHPALASRCALRPALRLVSEVSLVRRVRAGEGISYGLTWAPGRDTTIANVPLGYGDGYSRRLSGVGTVLCGGRRRPIAGRVTMDTIMIDCGDDDIRVGDEVVIIGSQGAEEITATELADALGTINYEVVCSIGPRVPRRYVG